MDQHPDAILIMDNVNFHRMDTDVYPEPPPKSLTVAINIFRSVTRGHDGDDFHTSQKYNSEHNTCRLESF